MWPFVRQRTTTLPNIPPVDGQRNRPVSGVARRIVPRNGVVFGSYSASISPMGQPDTADSQEYESCWLRHDGPHVPILKNRFPDQPTHLQKVFRPGMKVVSPSVTEKF